MRVKKNNFLSYLEENHYDEISDRLKGYIIKYREYLLVDKYDLIAAENIDIEDLGFIQVYIDAKDDDRIEFDIQCNPEISYTEVRGKYRTREAASTNDLWFTISCKGKVAKTLEGFYIACVDEYNKSKPHKPLSGNLVPIIYATDYENYAEEILNKFYPEALIDDSPINPEVLANRMGFTVIRRRIAQNKNVFGQVYFHKCRVNLFNEKLNDYEEVAIDANTIIVDSSTNSSYSYGCENITIAHECVHGYLHRKAFNFAKLYNKNLHGLISCTTSGEIRHIDSDDESSYMESQANGIAACLLLPNEKLKRMFDRQVLAFTNIGDSRLDADDVAIQELSGRLNVTIYAVKKRLIDIGYEEVIGVHNYVDGKFLRPYEFKHGSLKRNETFTITTADLLKLIHTNSSGLIAKIITGQYVFVENHLCINDSFYVEYDRKGNLILSEYARFHMDECCMKFTCKSQIIKSSDVLMYCYLARGEVNLAMDMSLASAPDLCDPDVSQRFRDYNNIMNEVLRKIKGMDFKEAVEYILEVQGFQLKDITDITDDYSSLSYRQFERYKNGETKEKKLGVVVAMCLSMKVPPLVSNELIRLAGLTFTNSKQDSMLLMILSTCRGKKFDEINQMLESLGYERITNARDTK